VKVPVRDLALSRAFYERALEPLGVRVVDHPLGAGFALGDQDFWIMEAEGAPAPIHIAFSARDRGTVDAFHAAAVEAGGVDNGGPGLRPHYHSEYYAAFVLDPDGNNVEAVCHGDGGSHGDGA
jgi:catechol 2,3-dioxygenase-like lactoylglutathione lyase family enzyme